MTFRVGDYQAIELIGIGGSAQVFRGRRMADNYPVAIKIRSPDELPALQREAALAAALNHPHVPAVLDVVADDDRSALITELAAGGSLEDLLERRSRLSESETLTVLVPVAAVLAAAHERGLVHGDISTANILFDAAGRPMVADLGAARASAEIGRPVQLTPADAAPEVARGGFPGPASDLFAFGSILLACVAGRHAWPAADLRDVLIQSTAGQWPDPGDAVSDRVLAGVIRALLDPVAERRPGAAGLIMEIRSSSLKPAPIEFGPSVSGANGSIGAPRNVVGGSGARFGEDDPGLAERSRAVTRTRDDAVVLGPPADPGSRPRFGGRTRASAQHRRGEETTPWVRRRWFRVVGVAAICVLALALAVQGGLWWAGHDRPEPAAASGPHSPGRATSAPLASLPTTGPAGAVTSSSSRLSGSRPTSGTTASVRATVTPPVTPTVTTAVTTAGSRPSTTSVGSAGAVDWLTVVRGLDQLRGRAFATLDAGLLDSVYTANSPARAADLGMITRLRRAGFRVSGAAHTSVSVTPLGRVGGTADDYRVAVTDELPGYDVSDSAGRLVGRTPARGRDRRTLLLVRTMAGYRIDRVQPD